MQPSLLTAAVLVCLLTTAGSCHADHCTILEDKHYDGKRAMCRGQSLDCIPTNLPKGIVALDFGSNTLTHLPKYAFSEYQNLRYLNLSNNMIASTDRRAFNGLLKLVHLNLEDNALTKNLLLFPVDIFVDLHRLSMLNLQGNHFKSYPDWVFTPLVNLKVLYLPSLPRPSFGPGFSKLVNLTVLKIYSFNRKYPQCLIEKLTNETFQNFRKTGLETLLLNKCEQLSFVEDGVFEPLMSLQNLELTQNRIGIQKTLKLLRPFTSKGRQMERIWLNSIYRTPVNKTSDMNDHILTRESTQYLREICVAEFRLRDNLLTLIEMDAFDGSVFEKCVVKLDISNNCLLGNFYQGKNMSNFTNLEVFNISFQRLSFESTVPTKRVSAIQHNKLLFCKLSLPAKLKYLDLTGTLYFRGNYAVTVQIENTQNLNTFLFGYNSVYNRIHIQGIENITKWDMSGHSFFLVTETYFIPYTKLRTLIVRNCGLSGAPSFRTIFIHLQKLEKLDISENNLRLIPVIAYPDTITELILSHNKFETIPLVPSEYQNLKLLDMSFNSIGHLNKDTRDQLEEAYFRNNFQLIINGNTFSCGCENIDFVEWLMHTKVVLESRRYFTCILDSGEITTVENVFRNSQRFNRHCIGKLLLIATVSIIPLLILSLGFAVIVSKNLARYIAILDGILGNGIKLLQTEDFGFALYIGYSQEDIPFVFRMLRPTLEEGRHPLRLFLKDREVLPGVDIVEGIVEGINNSWKALLVVSHDFLNDQWSNFTINTAVYSMTDQIPDRIIVLLVDDVQVKDLPESLLNAVDEDFIFEVDDRNNKDQFWKQMREICHL